MLHMKDMTSPTSFSGSSSRSEDGKPGPNVAEKIAQAELSSDSLDLADLAVFEENEQDEGADVIAPMATQSPRSSKSYSGSFRNLLDLTRRRSSSARSLSASAHAAHNRSFNSLFDETRASHLLDLKANKRPSELAKDKIHKFFQTSALPNVIIDIPKFTSDEIRTGRLLGSGGFSDVREIVGINVGGRSVKRSNSIAPDNKESREFIAEHVLRPSGQARYAIKTVSKSKNAEDDDDYFWTGVVDLAIEVRFLAVLEFPHIAKLRATAACDPADPGFFIVLDRLYDTLSQRINNMWKKQYRHLSSLSSRLIHPKGLMRKDFLGERLTHAYHLSRAVSYLHQLKILHRDIKPDNIGFDARGDLKIFDLGLARDLDGEVKYADGMYQLTIQAGSLRYMAPEVCVGRGYDFRADVYSLTLVVWEMLTLKIPFSTFKREKDFLMNAMKDVRPSIPREAPSSLRSLLAQGWQTNEFNRISSKEFSAKLRAIVVNLRHGDETGLDDTRRRSTFSLAGRDALNKLEKARKEKSLRGQESLGYDY